MDHLQNAAGRKPSRKGITLFDGVITAFTGKTINPPALQVAMWEGLQLKWDYREPEKVLALHLRFGDSVSAPVLRIPLSEDELKAIQGYREKGGWGYYELKVEKDDDRAAVHVSFMNASNAPVSMLWIVDGNHRTRIRKAMNRFVGLDDPIFED